MLLSIFIGLLIIIAMQPCEPYDLHNTKISEVKEGVYEESKISSDADRVYDEAIPSQ